MDLLMTLVDLYQQVLQKHHQSPVQLLAATNHSMDSQKLPILRASNTTLSELVADNNLKIVSGYWKIPNNTKHNVAYYEKGLNMTIEYFRNLDVPLVFYHNIDLEKKQRIPLQTSSPRNLDPKWNWFIELLLSCAFKMPTILSTCVNIRRTA